MRAPSASLLAALLLALLPAGALYADEDKKEMGLPEELPDEDQDLMDEADLYEEIEQLKEDDFPDLVPREEGLSEEELLDEADFPDLVGVDDSSEIMDEFALLEEEALVESAARHRQEIGLSPSAITLITREDIATSGATTIPDLLRMVPGMEVIAQTPVIPSVGARQFIVDNNLYLVLIDGREINDDLLSMPLWMLQPVDIDDVERIEVIRGPASALYGANAVAGLVSITTRATSEQGSARAGIDGGQAGYLRLGAGASTRLGPWGMAGSLGGFLMGAYTDPRDPQGRKLRARGVIEHLLPGDRRLVLDGGFTRGTGVLSTALGKLHAESITTGHLQLAYRSEYIQGLLGWTASALGLELDMPLEFGGLELARFRPLDIDMHALEGQVHWMPPRLWEQLLLVLGAGGRVSWVQSGQFLDAETFSDPESPGYHQSGMEHWQARGGAFGHLELSPVEWATLTCSLRYDHNTVAGGELSPRLAAVFQPAQGHYLRMSMARAFRKPSFIESHTHVDVDFPDSSPLIGEDRLLFQEFMTRLLGNSELTNESLVSYELGYLGKYLDGRLNVSLDLYRTDYRNKIYDKQRIVLDDRGLPDLASSSYLYGNVDSIIGFFGGELVIRFSPSRRLSLLASWTRREWMSDKRGRIRDRFSKNLYILGGRFRTAGGFLGSLYAFARSGFRDPSVANPKGLLEPQLTMKMPSTVLLIGRLGMKWDAQPDTKFEAGIKLFLPVSPFADTLFRSRDMGGGVTVDGEPFGSMELAQMVTVYLDVVY